MKAASVAVQDFHEHASRCKYYLEENSAQPIRIEFCHDLQRLRSRARLHKYDGYTSSSVTHPSFISHCRPINFVIDQTDWEIDFIGMMLLIESSGFSDRTVYETGDYDNRRGPISAVEWLNIES